jgi:hypothetical protein
MYIEVTIDVYSKSNTPHAALRTRTQFIPNTSAECSFEESSQSVERYFDYTMGK